MTVAAVVVSIALVLGGSPVVPAPDDDRDEVFLEDEKETDAGPPRGPTGPPAPEVKTEYRWQPMCSPGGGTDTTCSLAYACPPGETMWNLYSRPPGGAWSVVRSECRGGAPTDDETVPAVTAGDVLREVRRLPLPKAQLAIQPADRTLVNLDTVFSTTAPKFDRTVTILGQRVRIIAKPTRYAWHFGAGATLTTATPGRPYPAMDVTHQYTKSDQMHRPRVDVTFSISYSVDGGPTQSLAQTITTEGPAASLTTREATPVLVD